MTGRDLNVELSNAARDGDLSKIKILLAPRVDLNFRNEYGMTPLMLASYMKHLDVVRELIKSGASLDVQDKQGRTALMRATTANNLEIIQELFEAGANINLQDINGWAVDGSRVL